MLLSRDLKIVRKLAKLCTSNPVELRCRHVAALVDKNKIISLGMNQAKSSPGFHKLSSSQKKQYIHAEYSCLKGAGEDCSRNTLYVVRVNRKGDYADSKPCEYCQKEIDKANVGRVVYTVDGGLVES